MKTTNSVLVTFLICAPICRDTNVQSWLHTFFYFSTCRPYLSTKITFCHTINSAWSNKSKNRLYRSIMRQWNKNRYITINTAVKFHKTNKKKVHCHTTELGFWHTQIWGDIIWPLWAWTAPREVTPVCVPNNRYCTPTLCRYLGYFKIF
jgi:hypothetical protein